jgi:ATP-dependent protease ClpP protease subunit
MKLFSIMAVLLIVAGPLWAEEECGDGIIRTMEVKTYEGELSGLSFVYGDRAYTKIFGGLSISDVTRLWNDIVIIREKTSARELHVFINSGGGDAFSGMALADELKRAESGGFNVICHASGIIASAAVPVFAVCNTRIAAPGTIFMVHESAIWKWPGRETASDIRSQGELMELLRDRYLGTLAVHSNLTQEQWGEMEGKTTYFTPQDGLTWGLIDKIE